jgi:hypothetical protein
MPQSRAAATADERNDHRRTAPHRQLRRVVSFAPDSIFAFVRWAANDHRTILSRIDIPRAVRPVELFSTVPHVRPGSESLLHQ